MYLKHPITIDSGKETRTVQNLLTNEYNQVEVPVFVEVGIGKLSKDVESKLSAKDKKKLMDKGILFKTENAAYTVPEPEGMKLVDNKKDDEVKKIADGDK